MKIVCDTNVLISGILFAGPPRDVLRLAIEGIVRNYISPAIETEFRDVISRKKFGLKPLQVEAICQQFEDTFERVFPKKSFNIIKADPDDNAILECAFAAKAGYIISGDAHLLELGKFGKILILSPAEFCKIIGQN